ncbi:ATP-binding protein [Aquincola tertiaricarbonis]|uniref:histidine kinase n=1 Tax=Aquincola tertiaricarbonis TaxID=391953 RepID=A0ABY4SGA0_AQUTE|nr:ATP-binding protein [Aquincola tertiaricarbonis]URI11529.1 ATP-binding protein [Aquincola tertiaricarbonis]
MAMLPARTAAGRWLRRRSMRARIALAFTTLALLLFGAISYLSAREAYRQSERDTAAALQQLAQRLSQRLDADMAARLGEVRQIAALDQLLDWQLNPTHWRVLVEGLQRNSRHYSWIGVATPDGQVLAATQGLLEGRNVQHRPWFQQGLRAPIVGDVHEAALLASLLRPEAGSTEPLRFVDVAAPLRRGGRTVAVVGGHLSWAWAEERRREALATVDAARAVEIVLVGPSGDIALGPRQPALPGPVDAGEAGSLTWSDGQRYLTATSASQPLDDYPGMGWTVVVRQPESTAFRDADALQHRLWWLGGAGALLFGLVGWWITVRLTGPLRRVARRAQALMPEAAQQVTHDEVDQLGASLTVLLEDLRQREQSLRALNESLETRVQQRTELLQLANEDLRHFSRSLAHDLRGPLGAMGLVLGQVLEGEQPPRGAGARRSIEVVAQECERLRQLTDELLTLALVDQRDYERAPVDTDALVEQALAEVRAGAIGTPAEVTVPPLPAVVGDALMLRQVWTNLLSNAFKYSSKAERPQVVLSAREEGDETVFCVGDNGRGFDPGQSARLFGVFQRLHAASEFPGTGVGLSIVRRVVHRHGGRVWAESAPGQGARFYFTLPRQPAR